MTPAREAFTILIINRRSIYETALSVHVGPKKNTNLGPLSMRGDAVSAYESPTEMAKRFSSRGVWSSEASSAFFGEESP